MHAFPLDTVEEASPMSETPMKSPVRYSRDVERAEPEEAQTSEQLNEQLHGIMETTSQDYGHAVRSVHAKSHGLLEGELTIADGLPDMLGQGLFAQGGRYKVVMRFSTNPGDLLDDSISVPRGVAIKILGVSGDRLPGSEGDSTQDFVMVNGPAFSAAKGSDFLANLKLLAKTTDKAEGAKKLLSAVLRGTEAALELVGLESATIKQLGGHPNTHPLGDTYYTQTPFRFGDYIAKFSLAPVSPNLTDLSGDHVDTAARPDALREVIRDTMIEQDGEWELRVQLCTDLEKMPIEDSSKPWDEKESPYRPVGRIRAPAQIAWSTDRARVVDDQLAFSPWHGLAAHQPLGSINRLRKPAYAMSADYRGQYNGCPIHEPAELEGLPS
jgi:hypothetical protein